jgi:hypothetical protein
MGTDWTKWAIVVAVGGPVLWLLATGAAGHAGAWLITALVASIGIRAVLRGKRFDPDRYRAKRR